MATTTQLFRNTPGGETFETGKAVFHAGDVAEAMYVVQEGTIEIKVGRSVVEIVEPGGLFGEMALIDGSTRSADAIAAEDSTVLAIDRKHFDFLITETPRFARTVMNVLVERLRAANSSCT